VVTNTIMPLKK